MHMHHEPVMQESAEVLILTTWPLRRVMEF
jgi:hypothetical protein